MDICKIKDTMYKFMEDTILAMTGKVEEMPLYIGHDNYGKGIANERLLKGY